MGESEYQDAFQRAEVQLEIFRLLEAVVERDAAIRQHVIKVARCIFNGTDTEDGWAFKSLTSLIKEHVDPAYEDFKRACKALNLVAVRALHDRYMRLSDDILPEMDNDCFLAPEDYASYDPEVM